VAKKWVDKQYLLAWIFNVGRGNCALVRTPSKDAIVIDCGGKQDILASVEKHVFPFCKEHECLGNVKTMAGQIIISHPHVDHFRQIEKGAEIHPVLWTCPHDKPPEDSYPDERLDWDLIQNPEEDEGLVERYKAVYKERVLPLQTFVPTSQVPHFSYGIFYIPPPQCKPIESSAPTSEAELPKKDYANNTSIMVYFRFNKNSILFPGDMMPSGMKRVLEIGSENRLVGDGIPAKYARCSANSSTFRTWVNSGCSVLVAPHHGLESGYSAEFFASLPLADPRVGIVIISEKTNPRRDQGKVHNNYRDSKKVKGMLITHKDGVKEKRLSITTRTDGHCLVGFRGTDQTSVVVSQDLNWILTEGPDLLFI